MQTETTDRHLPGVQRLTKFEQSSNHQNILKTRVVFHYSKLKVGDRTTLRTGTHK
jgi:hypothetical protein